MKTAFPAFSPVTGLFGLCLHRVDGGEVSAERHNRERDEKRDRRQFLENQKRKCGADERCGSVIGTGFCRAEVALGINVKINTQTVSDKTQQQRAKYIRKFRERFAGKQGDNQRPES